MSCLPCILLAGTGLSETWVNPEHDDFDADISNVNGFSGLSGTGLGDSEADYANMRNRANELYHRVANIPTLNVSDGGVMLGQISQVVENVTQIGRKQDWINYPALFQAELERNTATMDAIESKLNSMVTYTSGGTKLPSQNDIQAATTVDGGVQWSALPSWFNKPLPATNSYLFRPADAPSPVPADKKSFSAAFASILPGAKTPDGKTSYLPYAIMGGALLFAFVGTRGLGGGMKVKSARRTTRRRRR